MCGINLRLLQTTICKRINAMSMALETQPCVYKLIVLSSVDIPLQHFLLLKNAGERGKLFKLIVSGI